MSPALLPRTGTEPVGAVALLEYGDPHERACFQRLEDAVWEASSLGPAVLECVRLRGARIRGCRFCAAVRVTSAVEDGLTESDLDHLDDPSARASLPGEQQAALALVDRYLLDPRQPPVAERAELASVLGARGVVEVLVACASFASADLRIALGENREPSGSGRVERRPRIASPFPGARDWPNLEQPLIHAGVPLPFVDGEAAAALDELRAGLWSHPDLPWELVAACVVRGAQVLGVSAEGPGFARLVPPEVQADAPPEEVATWPERYRGLWAHGFALAEQLWLDPAGVDGYHTDPLVASLGIAGLIRTSWALIWIGQFHRIAATLAVPEEAASSYHVDA